MRGRQNEARNPSWLPLLLRCVLLRGVLLWCVEQSSDETGTDCREREEETS